VRSFAIGLGLAVSVRAACPASAAANDGDVAQFGVTASRVAVDLVVRDKDGKLQRDLTRADVEVYEDGVRQSIDNLELVERPTVANEPAPSVGPAETPALLAIVLDGLGSESLRAARDALVGHLDGNARTPKVVGIFAIERSLKTLQAFTDNPITLRRSLDALLLRRSTGFSGLREREDIRHAHAGLGDGSPQTSALPAELAGEPECRMGGDDLVRRFKVLQSRIKESFDVLERDQKGSASMNGLLSLVDGLGALPGRKAVLLFSEGLSLPSTVESSFRSVVAAANRAGVSVYAADAMGLRPRNAADETRRSLETLRTRLELVQAAPPGIRGPGSAEMGDSGLALLERNEDLLRFAPESGLSRLAEQTGGFLLHGTNDLGSALARIDEDLGAYYLLSYSPKNPDYDGRFRTIQVKVKPPHGRVQSRQGYLALRTPLPSPVLENEAKALARLDRSELPTVVPVRMRALQYPESSASFVVPIVVEVPAGTFSVDRRTEAPRRDFTILAIVRDANDRIVTKMSQRYVVAASVKDARSVLFYREARLAPGAYTVEVLAQDALSARAGGARVKLDLEAPAAGHLRASSLMRVGRAEPLQAGDEKAPEALRYQGVLLYPEFSEALRAEAGKPVVLFLTAWPSAERPEVEAHLELLHDGRVRGVVLAGRHVAGPDGRVQIASSFPAASLAPGAYELRVTLSDGKDAETRSESLRIER
jgi:VWFA-related protein